MTLKETPAMASWLENHVWSIRELIEESAEIGIETERPRR